MEVQVFTWEYNEYDWWRKIAESDALEWAYSNGETRQITKMVPGKERERRRWDLLEKKQFRERHSEHGTWEITRERTIRRITVA